MSKKIDWSKAPEGATVLLKHVRDGAYAVSESYDDEAKTWHWPYPRYSFNLMPSMWRIVAERPITPSWSGEGLPPVGVVCEFVDEGDGDIRPPSWPDSLTHGAEVEILAHYAPLQDSVLVAVFAFKIDSGRATAQAMARCFRPLRTPEQIAANEREEFARTLTFEMGKDSDNSPNAMSQARRMYDLGYRKQ